MFFFKNKGQESTTTDSTGLVLALLFGSVFLTILFSLYLVKTVLSNIIGFELTAIETALVLISFYIIIRTAWSSD